MPYETTKATDPAALESFVNAMSTINTMRQSGERMQLAQDENAIRREDMTMRREQSQNDIQIRRDALNFEKAQFDAQAEDRRVLRLYREQETRSKKIATDMLESSVNLTKMFEDAPAEKTNVIINKDGTRAWRVPSSAPAEPLPTDDLQQPAADVPQGDPWAGQYLIPDEAYNLRTGQDLQNEAEENYGRGEPISAYNSAMEHALLLQRSANPWARKIRQLRSLPNDPDNLPLMKAKNDLAAWDPAVAIEKYGKALVIDPLDETGERRIPVADYMDRVKSFARTNPSKAAVMINALPAKDGAYIRDQLKASGLDTAMVHAARPSMNPEHLNSLMQQYSSPADDPVSQVGAVTGYLRAIQGKSLSDKDQEASDMYVYSSLSKPIVLADGRQTITSSLVKALMDIKDPTERSARAKAIIGNDDDVNGVMQMLDVASKDEGVNGLVKTIKRAEQTTKRFNTVRGMNDRVRQLADKAIYYTEDDQTTAGAKQFQMSRRLLKHMIKPDAALGGKGGDSITDIPTLNRLHAELADAKEKGLKADTSKEPVLGGGADGKKYTRAQFYDEVMATISERVTELSNQALDIPALQPAPVAPPASGKPPAAAPASGVPVKAPTAPVAATVARTNALVAQFKAMPPEAQYAQKKQLEALVNDPNPKDPGLKEVATNILNVLDYERVKGEDTGVKEDWNTLFAPAMALAGGAYAAGQAALSKAAVSKVAVMLENAGLRKGVQVGWKLKSAEVTADIAIDAAGTWAVNELFGADAAKEFGVGQLKGALGYSAITVGKKKFAEWIPKLKAMRASLKEVQASGIPSRAAYEGAKKVKGKAITAQNAFLKKVTDEHGEDVANAVLEYLNK